MLAWTRDILIIVFLSVSMAGGVTIRFLQQPACGIESGAK